MDVVTILLKSYCPQRTTELVGWMRLFALTGKFERSHVVFDLTEMGFSKSAVYRAYSDLRKVGLLI